MRPITPECLEYIRERNDQCELTQCDVRVLIAEIERLREALEKIAASEPKNPDPWQNSAYMAQTARAALQKDEG